MINIFIIYRDLASEDTYVIFFFNLKRSEEGKKDNADTIICFRVNISEEVKLIYKITNQTYQNPE